jgi:hypothetical protein
MSSQAVGHPPGLYMMFFAELWERFCYYGMRALLALYVVQQFDKAQDEASVSTVRSRRWSTRPGSSAATSPTECSATAARSCSAGADHGAGNSCC